MIGYLLLGGGPGLCVSYFYKGLSPLMPKKKIIGYQQLGAKGPYGDQALPDTFSVSDLVENLRDFIREKEDTYGYQLNFIAHSWGAYLALRYAEKYPSDLRQFLFISPIPFTYKEYADGQSGLVRKMSQQDLEALNAFNLSNDPHGFKTMGLINSYFAEKPMPKAKNLFYYDSVSDARIMRQVAGYDVRHLAKRLYGKIWYCVGKKDLLYAISGQTGESLSQIYDRYAPQNNIKILEDVGHYPFYENQAQTKQILDAWCH